MKKYEKRPFQIPYSNEPFTVHFFWEIPTSNSRPCLLVARNWAVFKRWEWPGSCSFPCQDKPLADLGLCYVDSWKWCSKTRYHPLWIFNLIRTSNPINPGIIARLCCISYDPTSLGKKSSPMPSPMLPLYGITLATFGLSGNTDATRDHYCDLRTQWLVLAPPRNLSTEPENRHHQFGRRGSQWLYQICVYLQRWIPGYQVLSFGFLTFCVIAST